MVKTDSGSDKPELKHLRRSTAVRETKEHLVNVRECKADKRSNLRAPGGTELKIL